MAHPTGEQAANEFWSNPENVQLARANLAGNGVINPHAARSVHVTVKGGSQFRAAVTGRQVRALPTAAARKRRAKIRKVRRAGDSLLRLAGLVMVLCAVAMAFGAGLGAAL